MFFRLLAPTGEVRFALDFEVRTGGSSFGIDAHLQIRAVEHKILFITFGESFVLGFGVILHQAVDLAIVPLVTHHRIELLGNDGVMSFDLQRGVFGGQHPTPIGLGVTLFRALARQLKTQLLTRARHEG